MSNIRQKFSCDPYLLENSQVPIARAEILQYQLLQEYKKWAQERKGLEGQAGMIKKYNLVLEVNMMCAFRHSKIIKKGKILRLCHMELDCFVSILEI